MSGNVKLCVAELAKLRRTELRPGWADAAGDFSETGADALNTFAESIGWSQPVAYDDPKAHEFPLLFFHPQQGWAVAERLEGENRVAVLSNGRLEHWFFDEGAVLFDLHLPEPPSEQRFDRAIDVFKTAILKRKRVLILAIFATFIVNFIALGTSIYSMQVYDRVIPRGNFSTLWALSIGLVVAVLFDFALRVIRARLLEDEAVSIDSEVSEYFFARANDVRLDARPPSVGTMAAQLKGLEQIRATMSSAVLFAVADLPFALLFIVVVWMLGGPIAIVTLISFPLSVAIALVIGRMIKADTEKAQVSSNKKSGLLVEAIDASETMKATRGQWYFLSKWNGLVEQLHEAELPVKNIQSVAGSIFGTIQQFAYTGIIAWGAYEVYERNMTQGALIACSILAGRINGPLIGQLPGMIVGWTYTKISLGMLDSILKLPTDKAVGSELLRPNRMRGDVSLRDVTFVHPGARVGLTIPHLDIKAGERVGVIGAIGSGKSTMLRLMSGLYAPVEGRVLVDGLDAATVADDVLRRHVGYLPQDYRLVNGTLRDNLLLGLSDPGDDAIMEAANMTGLAQLIADHPLGVDLPISEGGRGLSGGQRVLAGLTRMFLANPGLWLLDEPTSNLDAETEMRVLGALRARIQQGATVVIVTHKPQLLNLTERLLVVAGGQVVMDGPTREVVAQLNASAQPKPAAPAAAPATTQAAPAVTVVKTVPVGGVA